MSAFYALRLFNHHLISLCPKLRGPQVGCVLKPSTCAVEGDPHRVRSDRAGLRPSSVRDFQVPSEGQLRRGRTGDSGPQRSLGPCLPRPPLRCCRALRRLLSHKQQRAGALLSLPFRYRTCSHSSSPSRVPPPEASSSHEHPRHTLPACCHLCLPFVAMLQTAPLRDLPIRFRLPPTGQHFSSSPPATPKKWSPWRRYVSCPAAAPQRLLTSHADPRPGPSSISLSLRRTRSIKRPRSTRRLCN